MSVDREEEEGKRKVLGMRGVTKEEESREKKEVGVGEVGRRREEKERRVHELKDGEDMCGSHEPRES